MTDVVEQAEVIEERAIEPPTAPVPASQVTGSSLVARIAALPVGGTESISRRLSLDKTDHAMLSEVVLALRSTLTAAVGRAGKRSGGTYVTETTKGLTRTDDIIVTASATRLS